jgi:hypothetical protein
MTGEINVEPILDRWLSEGTDILPDQSIEAVLRSVDRTAQRRVPRARGRFPVVSGFTRPALVAGATIAALTAGGLVFMGGGQGPSADNPIPTSTPSPSASTVASLPAASPTPRETATSIVTEVGPVCGPEATASLPDGPLPVTSRPLDLPTSDGMLAASGGVGPRLIDSTTGGDVGPILISSQGRASPPGAFTVLHWSPDGRWVAGRHLAGEQCGNELIVSSDRLHGVNVTGYPDGVGLLDAAWSPDGHWLAVDTAHRIDVFGISADGRVSDARTVWRSDRSDRIAFGIAWGPGGSIAFSIEDGPRAGHGSTVAFLAPGASTPIAVHTTAGVLAPLAWLSDGSAVVALGDVGSSGAELFRISPAESAAIPLPGLHLHGGKWLDVPVAIVGDHLVLDAYLDDPEVEYAYSLLPDGSDLTRLDVGQGLPIGSTFAAAPDGRRVAISSRGPIWVVDVATGAFSELSPLDGGLMVWQPVP